MSHGLRRVSRRAFLGGAVLSGAAAVTVAVVADEQAGAHPAARMGWYRGDLARLVWRSPVIRRHRQRRPGFDAATRTVITR
ncbi:MAG TPA: hypothetical protein VID31_08095 [Streptosporangiaceae bacterium]|jgi:hypothetical protein